MPLQTRIAQFLSVFNIPSSQNSFKFSTIYIYICATFFLRPYLRYNSKHGKNFLLLNHTFWIVDFPSIRVILYLNLTRCSLNFFTVEESISISLRVKRTLINPFPHFCSILLNKSLIIVSLHFITIVYMICNYISSYSSQSSSRPIFSRLPEMFLFNFIVVSRRNSRKLQRIEHLYTWNIFCLLGTKYILSNSHFPLFSYLLQVLLFSNLKISLMMSSLSSTSNFRRCKQMSGPSVADYSSYLYLSHFSFRMFCLSKVNSGGLMGTG